MEPTVRLRVDPRRVVHETVDGEVVIIHLDRGDYYSLRGTAAQIWTALDAGYAVGDLRAALERSYPDAPATAGGELTSLVAQLVDEDLLTADDGPPVSPHSDLAVGAATWQSPVLEKYTDMQDYLRADPIHEVEPAGWPNVRQA